MKSAATPEVIRVVAHPIVNSNGLRKIPPPTPVSPASSPMPAPLSRATPNGGAVARSTAGSLRAERYIRQAASSRTMPTSVR